MTDFASFTKCILLARSLAHSLTHSFIYSLIE